MSVDECVSDMGWRFIYVADLKVGDITHHGKIHSIREGNFYRTIYFEETGNTINKHYLSSIEVKNG